MCREADQGGQFEQQTQRTSPATASAAVMLAVWPVAARRLLLCLPGQWSVVSQRSISARPLQRQVRRSGA